MMLDMENKATLPLIVDSFEPVREIVPLLQQSIPVTVANLNLSGFADYFWTAVDNHTIQAERKQNGELLSSLSDVEIQLRKQYNKTSENILLIEGFIIKSPDGYCQTLKRSKDNRFFYLDKEYKTRFAALLSWLYQLDKSGITTYSTADLMGTASLLSALYSNSQNPEHTTLNRYLKPKIYIEEQNPQIKNLMMLEGVNLGPEKSKALIDRFGTLWGVLVQDEEVLMSVSGIGKTIARKILKSAGRIK